MFVFLAVSAASGVISAGNLIASGVTLYEEWTLSVDLQFPFNSIPDWSNVLILQGLSLDGTVGYRIPAVFMGSSFDPNIHVMNHVNGDWNHETDLGFVGTDWFTLTIEQRDIGNQGNYSTFMYAVFIDGNKVYELENWWTNVWKNVDVWIAGDSRTGSQGTHTYGPSVGHYNNFLLRTINCELD